MLRPAILPSSTSLQSTIVFSNLSRDPDARRELAAEYATAYSELDLWEWVSNVLDCRRLVTMLGVDDERVWASMTVAWDVLLQALNMSCVMRAAVDESRGVDTSAIRALLNRGLGMFEGPSDLDPSE
ncbi:hypothetical protein FRB99_001954 [Tulasnella sp. 403]|nr:hypothetical protein FRB99_001954 [Tulasnella sp. 403]